jgi:hypothetical protein
MIRMDAVQQSDLLLLLKTLADEQRLTMVGLMSQRECTVTEMAGLLALSEPTISHHVSKMHSAGLLRLRMAGNQRFYRINEIRLATFKSYAANIDSLPTEPLSKEEEHAWIDALDWDAADKKVLRDYTKNERLVQFPTKDKKWLVILRWLATKFEPGVCYKEKQVNAVLTQFHEDYAVLRRSLVDYGFMRRERGGGNYWLTPEDKKVG